MIVVVLKETEIEMIQFKKLIKVLLLGEILKDPISKRVKEDNSSIICTVMMITNLMMETNHSPKKEETVSVH